MPEPIQSSQSPNQSYYDPSEQVSCPGEPAMLATAGPTGPSAMPEGKDLLLRKYGSGGEDCTKQLVTAGASFIAAGASAAGSLVTAPTVLGPVVGMVVTAGGIVNGFAELADYFNCEDKNERLREAAAECGAQGGTLVSGAGDSEAACLLLGE